MTDLSTLTFEESEVDIDAIKTTTYDDYADGKTRSVEADKKMWQALYQKLQATAKANDKKLVTKSNGDTRYFKIRDFTDKELAKQNGS